MKNPPNITHTNRTMLIVTAVLVGILAGLYLVQRPVDIRNRASEISSCQSPLMTCSVDISSGTYDNFVLQIIDPLDPGTPLLEGAQNQTQIQIATQPDKVYECRVASVSDSGCWEKTQGGSPVCVGPSATPTRPRPSSTPFPTPTTVPTIPVLVSPTVAPPTLTLEPTRVLSTELSDVEIPPPAELFPGCPLNLKNIEPTLCVTNEQGQCF